MILWNLINAQFSKNFFPVIEAERVKRRSVVKLFPSIGVNVIHHQIDGITPSMSRCGNCYDNAMPENFFGIHKTGCIYRHKLKSFDEARQMIDDYIYFYKNERIQLKTKLTPLEKRCQLA
jgi:transposase InsO family protein